MSKLAEVLWQSFAAGALLRIALPWLWSLLRPMAPKSADVAAFDPVPDQQPRRRR